MVGPALSNEGEGRAMLCFLGVLRYADSRIQLPSANLYNPRVKDDRANLFTSYSEIREVRTKLLNADGP
jgi:hypothetical protein